jgi:hypothetical protein
MVGFIGNDWAAWAVSPGRRCTLSSRDRSAASVAVRLGRDSVGFRESAVGTGRGWGAAAGNGAGRGCQRVRGKVPCRRA